MKTTTAEYVAAFDSWVSSLRTLGVIAPVFVSVASKGLYFVDSWNEDDPIAIAQRRLPDAAKGIYAGPDTNAIIPPLDRYDKTHFAKTGQEKFASEWARILSEYASASAWQRCIDRVVACSELPLRLGRRLPADGFGRRR